MSVENTIPLDLYAAHVVSADKSSVERASLEGKMIGLYFSAHWCGPCRAFTPVLVEAYKAITEAGHAFEIVFVSADESEEEALSYFESMPWKMLAFDQRELNDSLNEKLGIQGIPCLVLLDKDGKVITNEGREVLLCANFENIASFAAEKKARQEKVQKMIADLSASPAAVVDYLASLKIVNKQGETVSAEQLKSKELIGLYFAASWSPASRNFTPVLVEKYNSFLADNKSFEVIFVSYDQEPGADAEYFAEMPWTMLVNADEQGPQKIFKRVFQFNTIPMLVLLNSKEILTVEGEGAIHTTSDSFEDLFSFPERERAANEKEWAECRTLPDHIMIAGHHHPLVKKNFVYCGRFTCDMCKRSGMGCAYHCLECTFDAHINCILNPPKTTDEE